MSAIIRKSLEKRRELSSQMSREITKMTDYFICYLIIANEKIKRSEKLIFHSPTFPSKKKKEVILSKDGVVDYYGRSRGVHDFLSTLWIYSFSINGVEESLKDLEKSPINERITPEMIMNKYNEYRELREGYSAKHARGIFLERNLGNK